MSLENGAGKSGFNAKMAFLAPFVVVVALAVLMTALITIGMSGHFSAREKAITQAAYSEIARANEGRLPENIACDPPADLRTSNLCAQWKAADAARDGANWSAIGICISFITLLAVCFGFWQSGSVQRQEFRGYIRIEAHNLNQQIYKAIGARLNIVNYGRTMAKNVRSVVRKDVVFHNPYTTIPLKLSGDEGCITLHPEDKTYVDVVFGDDTIEECYIILFILKYLRAYIQISVFYEDVFGKKKETHAAYEIVVEQINDGYGIRYILLPDGNWAT
ncbi:MAG: hypothetical protein QM645_14215 [Asticcacaulis sp.]